uniref:Pancreatic trypsin inhibitor n=1 Tax=Rhipicephalus zambeziensis TaxID=60191 RepID=A0A224Y2I1_9ACAR
MQAYLCILAFTATFIPPMTAKTIFSGGSANDECAQRPANDCTSESPETKWFFDRNAKNCTPFSDHGCDSDDINRFPSEDICEETCNPPYYYLDDDKPVSN